MARCVEKKMRPTTMPFLKHIVVVVATLSRRTQGRGALEDERGHQIAIRAEVEERGWPGLRGCDQTDGAAAAPLPSTRGKGAEYRQVARAAVRRECLRWR